MTTLAYLNGRFLALADAGLSLADLGFASGATIVDNARTFDGVLFRYPEHLARFRRDCAACHIPFTMTDAEVNTIADQLIRTNRPSGGELHLVLFATPGLAPIYGLPNSGPTVGMLTHPVPRDRYLALARSGVRLQSVRAHSMESELLSPRYKQRSRMIWHVASAVAQERDPRAVAVLYDPTADTLTETAIASLLAVRGGVVVSPRKDLILDGMSLQVVENWCQKSGTQFAEASITLTNLAEFSELFLAGTGFGVVGVATLDGHALPFPGPITRRLQDEAFPPL